MARPNKMWWWEQKGEYAVTIKGTRHRLGADEEAARRQFHALLSKEPEEQPKLDPKAAVVVMDTFLEEATSKSPETKAWYQKHLQSFGEYLKSQGLRNIRVGDLAPHHVHKWLKSHKAWSDSTKNGCCRAVQRAFRWANQMGYIKVNPLAFIPDKPPAGSRENVITTAQFKELLGYVKDEDFRDLLTVSWECGCRPQESVRVERRHVDEKQVRWEFPKEEAKGKKKVRYVYLTDAALAICKRRMVKFPEGPIFRNRRGRPWTRHSVNCRMVRLKEKIGRKVALYDFRHSFTERMRQAGVADINIAALLGHADLSMLGKIYAHPHTSPASLLEELKKGAG